MMRIGTHLYIDENAVWLETTEGFSKYKPVIQTSDKYLVTEDGVYSKEGYPVANFSSFEDMYVEFDDGLVVPAERLVFYRSFIKDQSIIKSILGLPVVTKRLPIQIDVDYIKRVLDLYPSDYTILLDGFVYMLEDDKPEFLIMRGAFKAVNNPRIQNTQLLYDWFSVYEAKDEGFWLELNMPRSVLKRIPYWEKI